MAQREFTGKHAAAVFIGAFSVIIGVNIVLAVSAVRTFPGLEVQNTYVASQQFDARRKAQLALGWTARAEAADGRVILSITDRDGNPVEAASLDAVIGRATQIRDDTTPEFRFDGTAYVAQVDLGAGNWNIRMIARAGDGTEFRQRIAFYVKG